MAPKTFEFWPAGGVTAAGAFAPSAEAQKLALTLTQQGYQLWLREVTTGVSETLRLGRELAAARSPQQALALQYAWLQSQQARALANSRLLFDLTLGLTSRPAAPAAPATPPVRPATNPPVLAPVLAPSPAALPAPAAPVVVEVAAPAPVEAPAAPETPAPVALAAAPELQAEAAAPAAVAAAEGLNARQRGPRRKAKAEPQNQA